MHIVCPSVDSLSFRKLGGPTARGSTTTRGLFSWARLAKWCIRLYPESRIQICTQNPSENTWKIVQYPESVEPSTKYTTNRIASLVEHER